MFNQIILASYMVGPWCNYQGNASLLEIWQNYQSKHTLSSKQNNYIIFTGAYDRDIVLLCLTFSSRLRILKLPYLVFFLGLGLHHEGL